MKVYIVVALSANQYDQWNELVFGSPEAAEKWINEANVEIANSRKEAIAKLNELTQLRQTRELTELEADEVDNLEWWLTESIDDYVIEEHELQ